MSCTPRKYTIVSRNFCVLEGTYVVVWCVAKTAPPRSSAVLFRRRVSHTKWLGVLVLVGVLGVCAGTVSLVIVGLHVSFQFFARWCFLPLRPSE